MLIPAFGSGNMVPGNSGPIEIDIPFADVPRLSAVFRKCPYKNTELLIYLTILFVFDNTSPLITRYPSIENQDQARKITVHASK